MTGCRYVDGYGYYTRAHEATCRDSTCDGCKPCENDQDGKPVRHCTARRTCTGHLDAAHPLTCPKCIGKTRTDLGAILTAVAYLPDEAIADGVDSEALNLLGPNADPIAWTIRAHRRLVAGLPTEADDQHHPTLVLTRVQAVVIRGLGVAPASPATTTESAAAFIGVHLARLAQDPRIDWPKLVTNIRAVRTHLEDVVNTTRRPERGAPCPACAKAAPLIKRYDLQDLTGAADQWVCPACKTSWLEAEYRLWVADDYLANATTLTAAEIAMVYGIKPATVRKWAERGEVTKRGRNARGQQTYDVTEARNRQEQAS